MTQEIYTAEPQIELPDMIDLEMVIDNLKNNKAPGCDNISAEMVKKGGKELKIQYYT